MYCFKPLMLCLNLLATSFFLLTLKGNYSLRDNKHTLKKEIPAMSCDTYPRAGWHILELQRGVAAP